MKFFRSPKKKVLHYRLNSLFSDMPSENKPLTYKPWSHANKTMKNNENIMTFMMFSLFFIGDGGGSGTAATAEAAAVAASAAAAAAVKTSRVNLTPLPSFTSEA